jgi:SAM-dependent methyltransferase
MITNLEFLANNVDILCCPNPKCGGGLQFAKGGLICTVCGRAYPVEAGIPLLFWANDWGGATEDVTERIKAFYEEVPFPDYDEFDSIESLREKARTGVFARLLDEQVPFGARVIECGCGTGQLTNFLSFGGRVAIGTDICLNSLKMAHEFRDKNGLETAFFLQMNLFQPCFRPDSFDLVISNGVLHHTSDPRLGFKSIARLAKPNGYVLIGLYHKYGRVLTDLRRWMFRLSRDKLKFLDRRSVDPVISAARRESWFRDQYKNPHESKHNVGEVLQWLKEAGLQFVKSIPKTVPFERLGESESLFRPDRLGNGLERWLADLGMLFSGGREGGFFVVIAKKPGIPVETPNPVSRSQPSVSPP